MYLNPAEADRLIFQQMVPFHREDCPLASAQGRVLRTEIRADRDLPPFDRVMLDGFALRAAALAAGVRSFRVTRVQAAGMRAFRLEEASDACIDVMTGAVLPVGADCVVPYEETQREGSMVTVGGKSGQFAAGHGVHLRASDHRAGEVLVCPGTRLTGREIAVAAACGHPILTVSQRPKIAVVATGDELVEVESAVAAHQIRRSNDYALCAALALAGYPNTSRFHLRDLPHEIEHLIWHVLAEFEVIVITGGVSKGKFDFLPRELDRQGVKKVFHGVAQKPGKPIWFGTTPRGTPVFALPGNPVSACTCLHRYVLPALAWASGMKVNPPRRVTLGTAVIPKANLAWFLPVRLVNDETGGWRATPNPGNNSGDFAGLVGTDGFVELAAGSEELPAGTSVPFWAW